LKLKRAPLGDFVTLKRGYDLPSAERHPGEIPVVSSSGITGYHDTAKANGPGVITGRYGTLGKVFFVEKDFWPLNTALYVTNFKGQPPRFVAYLLENVLSQTSSDKAAVPGVNRNDLHAREVAIPSDPESQRNIASTLSAYDDLIENNRRRIQLLEQAARLLFREWFVHLRFPGHEHVRIVDGVPEGWERVNIFDAVDIQSGGTPKTAIPEYWDGDIPFFTPKDALNSVYVWKTEKSITDQGLRNCNSRLFPKDTVFITARGTVGKVVLAQRRMAMNQSCYALVPRSPLDPYFLYFALQAGIQQVRSKAVGAVFDAIIRDTFKLIPLVIPNPENLSRYSDEITPIVNQIDLLLQQNHRLAQARDLLLPRLMNGEIAV